MGKFFAVMEGPLGRLLRVALGMVLFYVGLGPIGGTGGRILALGGLLAIVMGASGPCLVNLAIRRLRRVWMLAVGGTD
jgi:hypothetical protein